MAFSSSQPPHASFPYPFSHDDCSSPLLPSPASLHEHDPNSPLLPSPIAFRRHAPSHSVPGGAIPVSLRPGTPYQQQHQRQASGPPAHSQARNGARTTYTPLFPTQMPRPMAYDCVPTPPRTAEPKASFLMPASPPQAPERPRTATPAAQAGQGQKSWIAFDEQRPAVAFPRRQQSLEASTSSPSPPAACLPAPPRTILTDEHGVAHTPIADSPTQMQVEAPIPLAAENEAGAQFGIHANPWTFLRKASDVSVDEDTVQQPNEATSPELALHPNLTHPFPQGHPLSRQDSLALRRQWTVARRSRHFYAELAASEQQGPAQPNIPELPTHTEVVPELPTHTETGPERSPSPSDSEQSAGSTATPPSEVDVDVESMTPRAASEDLVRALSNAIRKARPSYASPCTDTPTQSYPQQAAPANPVAALVSQLREDENHEGTDEDLHDEDFQYGERSSSPSSVYSRPTSWACSPGRASSGSGSRRGNLGLALPLPLPLPLAQLVPSPLSVVTAASPSPMFSQQSGQSSASSMASRAGRGETKSTPRSPRPTLSLQTSPSQLQPRPRARTAEAGTKADYARFKAEFDGLSQQAKEQDEDEPAPAIPPRAPERDQRRQQQVHRRFSFEATPTTATTATGPMRKSHFGTMPTHFDASASTPTLPLASAGAFPPMPVTSPPAYTSPLFVANPTSAHAHAASPPTYTNAYHSNSPPTYASPVDFANAVARDARRAAWEQARQAVRAAEDAEIEAEIAAASAAASGDEEGDVSREAEEEAAREERARREQLHQRMASEPSPVLAPRRHTRHASDASSVPPPPPPKDDMWLRLRNQVQVQSPVRNQGSRLHLHLQHHASIAQHVRHPSGDGPKSPYNNPATIGTLPPRSAPPPPPDAKSKPSAAHEPLQSPPPPPKDMVFCGHTFTPVLSRRSSRYQLANPAASTSSYQLATPMASTSGSQHTNPVPNSPPPNIADHPALRGLLSPSIPPVPAIPTSIANAPRHSRTPSRSHTPSPPSHALPSRPPTPGHSIPSIARTPTPAPSRPIIARTPTPALPLLARAATPASPPVPMPTFADAARYGAPGAGSRARAAYATGPVVSPAFPPDTPPFSAWEGEAGVTEEVERRATQHAMMEPTQHAMMEPTQHTMMEPTQHATMEPTQHATMEPTQHEPTQHAQMQAQEEGQRERELQRRATKDMLEERARRALRVQRELHAPAPVRMLTGRKVAAKGAGLGEHSHRRWKRSLNVPRIFG